MALRLVTPLHVHVYLPLHLDSYTDSRARCAVGRSILVVIWHLLANPEARYVDLGPDWHARKLDTNRRTRSLMNQLRALHPDSEITITLAA